LRSVNETSPAAEAVEENPMTIRNAILSLSLTLGLLAGLTLASSSSAQEAGCDGAITCYVEPRIFPGPSGDLMAADVLVRDGVALFQGDIDVTNAPSFLFSGTVPKHELFLWPDTVMPYELDEGDFGAVANQIQEAIDEWNATTVLQLVPVDDMTEEPASWVRFVPGDLCASAAGKQGLGEQKITIAGYCLNVRGIILHEIGHAAGLWHEQMRSDAETYVTINLGNVASGALDPDYPEYEADQLRSYGNSGVDRGRYDYDSVMHYNRTAVSKNGLPTIVPKASGVTIGQRDGLSPGDIAGIAALYADMADEAEVGDYFGQALASCDFDGDGTDDLAVGVPGEDLVDANGGIIRDAGAVNVIYGSGPDAAGRLGAGLQLAGNEAWHLNRPEIAGAAAAYDRFGSALAAADFDDDGACDLAVGVPYREVEGLRDAGTVVVLFGSPQGFTGRNFLLSQPSASWIPGAEGPEAYDRFGSALAAADFNADGAGDLAIGVPYEDLGTEVIDAGMVNVIVGRRDVGFWGVAQHWHQDSPGIGGAAEGGDLFGWTLAAADFNRDGAADLAVGAPHEDVGSAANAGSVNVIYGQSTYTWAGLQSAGNRIVSQGNSAIAETPEAHDNFGWSLAAADFNGDLVSDLAIGAPGEDLPGADAAGVVHVLVGQSGNLSYGGGISISWAGLLRAPAPTAYDRFGQSLATLGHEASGRSDLAVGVPGSDEGQFNAGAVRVHQGLQSSGLFSTGTLWHRDVEGIEDEADFNESLGKHAMVGGDFDGDGNDDLAIGVPWQDTRDLEDFGVGDERASSGGVHVLYEDVHFGPGLSAEADQVLHQNS
jgi:hypothetical protein